MLLFSSDTLLAALLLALVIDGVAGDPGWLWNRLPHPVVLMGRMIAWLEKMTFEPGHGPRRRLTAGALTMILVTVPAAGLAWLLQIQLEGLAFGWVILGLLMSTLIAYRGLRQAVGAVALGLEGSLDEGRRAVAEIVGRDPDHLDRPAVARAAIESCAENFSDGVVAPAFWALLFGLPGLAAYKAINTLDSMIGHRSERYLYFGRVAARLDDAVNWPPARLAAGLIVLAAALTRLESRAACRAVRRDARSHRSPNAGWPEAAMAGALGLRLAGPRVYGGTTVHDSWMGEGRVEAGPADIRMSLKLLDVATAAMAASVGIGLLLV